MAAGLKMFRFAPGSPGNPLERVPHVGRHVHETARRTEVLSVFDIHQVRTFEDIEGFGRVAMHMHRRTEIRGFPLRLKDGELAIRGWRVRQDDRFEVSEVQESALSWL